MNRGRSGRFGILLGIALHAVACTPAGNGGAQAGSRNEMSADSRITMQRLPCYGTCPVYAVTIAADGTVTFDGEQHVDSVGRHAGRIARADVAALMRELESGGFFELQPRYVYPEKACGAYHTDAPRVILTVVLDDRSTTVEHDHGCRGAPHLLQDLQASVDRVAGVARWVGAQR